MPEFEIVGLAPDFVDYQTAWDLQRVVHEEVYTGKRPDTVLLLEHSGVYTAGKSDCDTEWSAMTEVESHLTNRVNKLVDDNHLGKNDSYLNIKVNLVKPSCSDLLVSEDTRFTYPLEAFRSMDTTSYHYNPFLYVNPQCEIEEDRIGLNSRLRIKDTFVPKFANPIDQTTILPKGGDISNELSLPSTYNMCKNTI
jgi:hypothetical protein